MIAITLIVLGLFQAQAASTELGYRFTLPEGFVAFAEARAASPDLVDCWSEATPVSPRGPVNLCVARMHAVLPREAMKPEEVPAPTQLVGYKWRAFDVQGLRTLTSQNGEDVFVLVAQVPLRHEAIQLVYSGPADQESRADSLMRATLASLEGESNWLTSEERSERLGRAAGVWIALGAAVVVVVWWRKRRAAA